MARITLKLDKRRALKDGSYPIVMWVAGKNLALPTGFAALPSEWSDDSAMHYLGKNASRVNDALAAMLGETTSRMIGLVESGLFARLSGSKLRQALEGKASVAQLSAKPSLGEIYKRVIRTHRGRTAKLYQETYTKLCSFCDPDKVQFEAITKLWLSEFCAHMSGLAPNTQSIHLRNLRAVVNVAIDEGITDLYAFRRFRLPSAKTAKRALSVEDLRRIASAEIDSPYVRRQRDYFMLIFYLVGINFVDLYGLKEIEGGRVQYHRAKTHRLYDIKVEPEALEIIDRYRGSKQLLDAADNYSGYRIAYMAMVRNLITLRDQLGLKELTSYSARHSWATIAASLDIPKETIAAALGHGGSSVTDIYIDFDRSKVDEANRSVIDWVLYGKR